MWSATHIRSYPTVVRRDKGRGVILYGDIPGDMNARRHDSITAVVTMGWHRKDSQAPQGEWTESSAQRCREELYASLFGCSSAALGVYSRPGAGKGYRSGAVLWNLPWGPKVLGNHSCSKHLPTLQPWVG